MKVAQKYFDLSNEHEMAQIEEMLSDDTTYSSTTTGVYLGRQDIMEMQRYFHGSFTTLHWDVISVNEVRPGVVLFDFHLTGERENGETIDSEGLEYIIVKDGRSRHIEVRGKS